MASRGTDRNVVSPPSTFYPTSPDQERSNKDHRETAREEPGTDQLAFVRARLGIGLAGRCISGE